MGCSAIKISIFIFLHISIVVESSRVKIHTHAAYQPSRSKVLRQTRMTACDDKEAVLRSSLSLSGQISMLNGRVQFYRSIIATQNINTLFTNNVVGIDMVTTGMVLEALKREGCPVYIFGGVVRDQFLGDPSKDVDVEVDCGIERDMATCVLKWGRTVCSSS